MSSVFTSSRLMFFVMVIVVLLTFTIVSFNSVPITKYVNEYNIYAIPRVQFDPYTPPSGNPNMNSQCGRSVKVTHGENSVVVRVVDRCEGSNAFERLASLSELRTECSWQYI
ncbi:4763_t:CDS:2 [Diversispora eburnea]|uniref:4763_t:CDS:1 n=1 Tax=Diversispora eburnea TaxID=1213867 RepID=A0A9N9AD81_9GLOM|nr:4763_t:CDS:2 [Diversispora eburnea]